MTTALTRFEPFAEALRLSDAVEQLLNESWVMPGASSAVGQERRAFRWTSTKLMRHTW